MNSVYLEVIIMKLAKWGNSIAVRIPAEVITKLGMAPNDEVRIEITGEHSFQITRDRRREEAIEKMRSMSFTLPDGYVFNREELYER